MSRPFTETKMRTLPILLAALAATPAAAAIDPAALDMRVAAFTGALPGHDGGARTPVDRRLQLADCAGEPALSWRTERRDAVVIACPGPVAWRIFVPVQRATPVAAASAASLPEKKVAVIKRGDPVTIGVDQGGFTISQDGIAMGDAAPGERVQVRVDGAKAPVQAVAVAAGQATIPTA